jgi:hypothetical protein
MNIMRACVVVVSGFGHDSREKTHTSGLTLSCEYVWVL